MLSQLNKTTKNLSKVHCNKEMQIKIRIIRIFKNVTYHSNKDILLSYNTQVQRGSKGKHPHRHCRGDGEF